MPRPSARQVLEVLARHRGERIVLTTMSAVGIWRQLSDTPRDFFYLPSAMGHAVGLAHGLALAQPRPGVIAVVGDGSLLMNLGCLVTLAHQPANVFVVLLDNEMYEVTGGQATAGSGHTDFAGLARAAGLRRVYAFEALPTWEAGAAEALRGDGPAFIWLRIEGRLGQQTPAPPHPLGEQIQRLRRVLGLSEGLGSGI
jgi:sulfopyruvate decarboxylase subunit beta